MPASRANQPHVSALGDCTVMPVKSMRPCVGRMPYRPQKLDGTRTEPPLSVPSAKSHAPDATADADPLEEPPGTRSGAAGLSGVPSCAFSPRIPSDTSSVTVFPTTDAPAASKVCTTQAWRVGVGLARGQSGLPPPRRHASDVDQVLHRECRPGERASRLPRRSSRAGRE